VRVDFMRSGGVWGESLAEAICEFKVSASALPPSL